MGSAPKQYCLGCLDARRPAPALGKLSRHGVLVKAPPAPAVGRQIPDRPAAPGSRLSRQRDHQDCVAAASDALLIPAGKVGMIMAGFVPISGYKCSKNRRDGRI